MSVSRDFFSHDMKTFDPSRRSKQQKAKAIHFLWLRFPPGIPEDSEKDNVNSDK